MRDTLAIAPRHHCAHIACRVAPRGTPHQHFCVGAHLHAGPLEVKTSHRRRAWAQLSRTRRRYWTGLAGEDPDDDWAAVGRAIRRADGVLVAVENDPNGWLLLALLLALWGPELPPSRWRIAWCVDQARWARGGTTLEPPRRLSADERRDARRLWAAATSSTPQALDELASSPTVGPSAQRILDQLPEEESGLTVLERHLIETCLAGPSRIRRLVGQAVLDFDEARSVLLHQDCIVARIRRLWRHGVLELSETSSFWDTPVTLQPLGQELLAGRRNLVEIAGLTEVVGAVRQSSGHGDVWFRRCGGGVVRRRMGA